MARIRSISRLTKYLAGVWLILLGGYVAGATWIPIGGARIAFGSVFLCVLPFIVNGALLSNAVTPNWRKNAFWMLLALGCSLWMAGAFIRTYIEVYQHRQIPDPFFGQIAFFLHTVPMIAALTIQPHAHRENRRTPFSYLDFSLLLVWWVYLYVFLVTPWQYVVFDRVRYHENYSIIYSLENFVFVAGAAALSHNAVGHWRRIYAHLSAAGAAYIAGSLWVASSTASSVVSAGSLRDLPAIVSLLCLGTAGVVAYSNPRTKKILNAESSDGPVRNDTAWASRLANTAVLSLPLIGLWCITISNAPMEVQQFRIGVTLTAVLLLASLVFLRQKLVDKDRLQLLRASQESVDNLKRLQLQLVQSEKLASLGQLVAGAAHEINNPLTAILGYSELMVDNPAMGEPPRRLAEKIREQALRTKTLVTNLLSFARQAPSEQRSLLDINAVVSNSLQLRHLNLRGKNIRIDWLPGVAIPAVRGDANQLLQVFFNIIGNAVEAMEEVGGGALTLRTSSEQGNVVILFSDTGPGIANPSLVFDPFYTTKPVGKGTGLGLSICYGLVNDHGGQISCYNRPGGGATFRIELPAVPMLFPPRDAGSAVRDTTASPIPRLPDPRLRH